jgi:hypothetical protein
MFLAATSMVMSLGKSQVIWDAIPFFEFIQFPWRWLSSGVIWLSLGASYIVFFIGNRGVKIGVMSVILLTSLVTSWWLFQPEKYLENADSLYYADGDRIQTHMSNILQDYIPIQMAAKLDENPKPPLPLVLTSTNPEYEVLAERTHQKLIRTRFSEDGEIELAVANFPGWYAELDGQTVQINEAERGNIQINIPKGEHVLGVAFGSTPVRQVSDGLSAASWLILFFVVLSRHQPHEKIRTHD